MDVRVSGHQVDTGEALRTRVEDRLRAADEKYAARLTSAQVTFGKGPHDHGFTCEIIAFTPPGVVVKATDRAAEAHAAFDGAAEKAEKQLRRLGRRRKDHHGDGVAALALEADDTAFRRGGDAAG